MLEKHTQDAVLLILSQDLSNFTKFKNEGLSLSKEYFNKENQIKFTAMTRAKDAGYDTLTHKFIEQYKIDMPMQTVTNNQFLDICLDVRKELTNKNKTEAKNILNDAFKKYQKSTDENEIDSINELRETLNKITTVQIRQTGKTLDEIIEEKFKYIKGNELIPTYLKEIDAILKGGFERGGIHVLSGFPGNGKTTLGVQFGTVQAINGYKVLFLSLEQKEEKIAANVLSVASEKSEQNRSYWNTAKLTPENHRDVREEAKKVVAGRIRNNFIIDDSEYATQREFVERLRKGALSEEYDVIIIDNFQNAPRLPGNETDERSYTRLADEVLAIAKISNTAVIALSQLTMSNGKEGTKYSKRLNEHAITNLKIELVEKEEDAIDDIEKVEITTLKARSGKQGHSKTFNFNGSKSIIGSFEMPEIDKEKKDDHEIKAFMK